MTTRLPPEGAKKPDRAELEKRFGLGRWFHNPAWTPPPSDNRSAPEPEQEQEA